MSFDAAPAWAASRRTSRVFAGLEEDRGRRGRIRLFGPLYNCLYGLGLRYQQETLKRLVSTVFFSVLFNGAPQGEFSFKRGIRQGDPISPYLFLLVVEGLSCILKVNDRSSTLHGVKVASSAPAVNHLLFADDSLLFFQDK
jgi:hypothetical protein